MLALASGGGGTAAPPGMFTAAAAPSGLFPTELLSKQEGGREAAALTFSGGLEEGRENVPLPPSPCPHNGGKGEAEHGRHPGSGPSLHVLCNQAPFLQPSISSCHKAGRPRVLPRTGTATNTPRKRSRRKQLGTPDARKQALPGTGLLRFRACDHNSFHCLQGQQRCSLQCS